MLCTDLMPRSNDSALEQAKCGLYGVGIDVAIDILAFAMVDGLMLAENPSLVQGLGVSLEVIRHNHINIFADVSRMYFARVPDFTSSA